VLKAEYLNFNKHILKKNFELELRHHLILYSIFDRHITINYKFGKKLKLYDCIDADFSSNSLFRMPLLIFANFLCLSFVFKSTLFNRKMGWRCVYYIAGDNVFFIQVVLINGGKKKSKETVVANRKIRVQA
jgi:hypothetical protein